MQHDAGTWEGDDEHAKFPGLERDETIEHEDDEDETDDEDSDEDEEE